MRSMYIMIIHTFKMDFILKVKRRSFFEKILILLDRNIYLHTIHVCAIKLIHRMFRYMNGLLKTMYMKFHSSEWGRLALKHRRHTPG